MPRRHATVCATAGCPTITRDTHCDEHRPRHSGPHHQSGSRRYPTAHKRLAAATIAAQPWCTYCGDTEDQVEARGDRLTADHVTARANGGRTSRDNYVTACGRCNSSKGSRNVTT